jgi:hypothetical protein
MPSFLSTKRSRVIAAAAGTLTLATAISAAAIALPSGTSAAPAGVSNAFLAMNSSHQTVQQSTQHSNSMSEAQNLASYDQVRFAQGAKQYAYEVSAKSAAAKAAAEHAAAARAAATKAAAAARAAAAKATAQDQTTAAQQSTATPSGSPQQIAQQMLGQYGWSASQFSCLQPLWEHESGWSVTAENPGSGAYGIPQALPGSQMASAGSDWQTNAATQIKWGLNYIQSRYGSPCGAWAHEQADNWY